MLSPKEAEELIRETQQGIIQLDASGRVVLFNSVAEGILGMRAESVIGKNVSDVLPLSWLPQVLESGRPDLGATQVSETGYLFTVDRLPIKEEGRLVGALAVLRDISNCLFAGLLKPDKGNLWLFHVLNALEDGIMVVDKDCIVRFINRAFTRMKGLTEQEVLGKPLASVRPGELLPKVIESGRPIFGVHRTTRQSQYVVDVLPITLDGQVIGGVTVAKDVTQVRKLAAEVELHAGARKELEERVRRLQSARYKFDDIIGSKGGLAEVCRMARKAALSDLTILIRGESGTGKELLAHAIHNYSRRAHQAFVVVNCTAIPPDLLESELFGYEGGSYTGARKEGKIGLFELANGGTLFLDEIGDMEMALQAKLLRVLQDRRFRRVGGLTTIEVDVRVVGATNRDLEKMVAEGQFREDIYYRLNVVPLQIPPLRARTGDIPALATAIVQRYAGMLNRPLRLDPATIAVLKEYTWPGNVREMENALGFACNMCEGNLIQPQHLPPSVCRQSGPVFAQADSAGDRLDSTVRDAERDAIVAALKKFGNSTHGKREAAKHLGVSLATLYNRLKALQIS